MDSSFNCLITWLCFVLLLDCSLFCAVSCFGLELIVRVLLDCYCCGVLWLLFRDCVNVLSVGVLLVICGLLLVIVGVGWWYGLDLLWFGGCLFCELLAGLGSWILLFVVCCIALRVLRLC